LPEGGFLPALCDEIGLPEAPGDETLTKREYINSRLARLLWGDSQARWARRGRIENTETAKRTLPAPVA